MLPLDWRRRCACLGAPTRKDKHGRTCILRRLGCRVLLHKEQPTSLCAPPEFPNSGHKSVDTLLSSARNNHLSSSAPGPSSKASDGFHPTVTSPVTLKWCARHGHASLSPRSARVATQRAASIVLLFAKAARPNRSESLGSIPCRHIRTGGGDLACIPLSQRLNDGEARPGLIWGFLSAAPHSLLV